MKARVKKDWRGHKKGDIVELKTWREIEGGKRQPDVFDMDYESQPQPEATPETKADPAADQPAETTKPKRRSRKSADE